MRENGDKSFSKELSSSPQQKMNLIQLAILALNEDECMNAQLCLDPDSIGRFCQVWG